MAGHRAFLVDSKIAPAPIWRCEEISDGVLARGRNKCLGQSGVATCGRGEVEGIVAVGRICAVNLSGKDVSCGAKWASTPCLPHGMLPKPWFSVMSDAVPDFSGFHR